MSEFKVGDHVTYQPYEKKLKAVVKEIMVGSPFRHVEGDEREFYRLTGRSYVEKHKLYGHDINKHDPVETVTTGGSICESKLFKERTAEGAFKD